MMKWKKVLLTVNGFAIEAEYSETAIQEIFLPLLRRMDEIQREKGRRILVFLAAPPAVGKSTLAEFLQMLSASEHDVQEIQALGLDGFHYHSDYILSHNAVIDGEIIPMKDVKGCPETYDLEKLKKKLNSIFNENILWPVYDRNLHDVVEDAVRVEKKIILLEGNWLLLKDQGWNELKESCDFSILITAKEETLKDRLVRRKMLGGLSQEDAERFYEKSDSRNVTRVLRDSRGADVILRIKEDNDYEKEY